MIRLWIGLLTVIAALVTGIATQASFDAEKQSAEHAKPPKTGRPDAAVHQGTPAPPAVTGADPTTTGTIVLAVWLEEQERQEREAVAAYLDALEQTRQADLAAEAARLAQARQAPNPPAPRSGTVSTPTACDGHVVPAYIVQRESGCDYGAVNPSGCGGNSCVGLYQFDLRHFTSGACSGLDWHNPADQDECARRLSNGGTNLAPWGG